MRICIQCPELTNAARCSKCERTYQRARNADPKRKAYSDPAYRAISLTGVCAWPGCTATTDLTRDHVPSLASMPAGEWRGSIRLLCRSHNSSKGASND
jgi:hypothetical protein